MISTFQHGCPVSPPYADHTYGLGATGTDIPLQDHTYGHARHDPEDEWSDIEESYMVLNAHVPTITNTELTF